MSDTPNLLAIEETSYLSFSKASTSESELWGGMLHLHTLGVKVMQKIHNLIFFISRTFPNVDRIDSQEMIFSIFPFESLTPRPRGGHAKNTGNFFISNQVYIIHIGLSMFQFHNDRGEAER
ncbi:hypothetical protein [Sphingobium sp. YC-XJ3]|uniref:hypothetical protein n=1 Tax=Sphingobium sp. YC-XJ3 TaxID=3024245 RepID=UPI002362EE5E|nr:hypothetical protein [Sphingobium sp. YC-XJ3]WDA38955.1 hypothetical protein PO876_12640 [Sphingobium sp. YC-XJ3]